MTRSASSIGDPPDVSQARGKAVVAGGIGNFVEWYDFALYGYFATTIATLFFPGSDPSAALLKTFAIFGVGFFVRPFGGILFGHIGDHVGRRSALAMSVLLMSLSTAAIGLLPTHHAVGVAAPVLLLCCRLLQGFSAGGEYAGSNAFVIEYAPAGRRGRYASALPVSVVLGTAAGALVALLVTSQASAASLDSWAWRVPFFTALPLGLAGLYLRLRIEDSPVFRAVQNAGLVEQVPLAGAIRTARAAMITLFFWAIANAVGFYLLAGYMISYLTTQAHLASTPATLSYVIALLVFGLSSLATGRLTERVDRRVVGIAAVVGLGVAVMPAFALLGAGSFGSAVAGLSLFGFFMGGISTTTSLLVVDLFPANVRYSASSLSYNLSYTAFGGSAPYVATWLVSRTHNNLAPGWYLLLAAVISLITMVLAVPHAPETLLPETDPVMRQSTPAAGTL